MPRIRPFHVLALAAAVGALTWYALLPRGTLPNFFHRGPHPETARYTQVETARVPMADRFRSYESVTAASGILDAAGFRDRTLTVRHRPKSTEYPPYDFDVLRVRGYRHLGTPGTLILSFFNDRLFEAEFDPEQPDVYARKLPSLGLKPVSRENARAEVVQGNLRMASSVGLAVSTVGKAMQTQPFVLWQDRRLIRQREEWDAKYGGIPMPMSGAAGR